MALNYSYTQANQNSADYRIIQRPQPRSTAEKIAHLEQWLADRADQAWRPSWKEAEKELALLKGEAR